MKQWKVVISSSIHQVGVDALKPCAEVALLPDLEPATVERALKDADGIILRSFGYMSGDVMDKAPKLRVIARHGVGVDNVDVPAATERGIWVVNTPLANAEAVAEHVVGAMLAFQRRIVVADRAVRQDDWSLRDRNYGVEILGGTLGVVGVGRIGARVAEIAVKGFSMRVLYTDVVRRDDLESELGIEKVALEKLLAKSDIVTVHAPATPETTGMFNLTRFRQMKDAAVFINAARGKLHNEADLIEALESGTIAGACLDVFENEPLSLDSPLMTLPNVILSPHKAGQSETSMRRMALVAEDVIRVLRGDAPEFPVNRPANLRRVGP